MLRKTYSKTKRSCRVTFELPVDLDARGVALCGEFNDWDTQSHRMKRRKDGRFALTLSLDAGRNYRFRYLLDGKQWENDQKADDYQPNPFGTMDSLLQI